MRRKDQDVSSGIGACLRIYPLDEPFREESAVFPDGCLLIAIVIFVFLLYLGLFWPTDFRFRNTFSQSHTATMRATQN